MAEEARKEENVGSEHGNGKIQVGEQAIGFGHGIEALQVSDVGVEERWRSRGLGLLLSQLDKRLGPHGNLDAFARLGGEIAPTVTLGVRLHQELKALALHLSPRLSSQLTILQRQRQRGSGRGGGGSCVLRSGDGSGGRSVLLQQQLQMRRNWRSKRKVGAATTCVDGAEAISSC